MDALELALKCSSLLMRSMTRGNRELNDPSSTPAATAEENCANNNDALFGPTMRRSLDDSDCERHFNGMSMIKSV
jgi:hypothetical protein